MLNFSKKKETDASGDSTAKINATDKKAVPKPVMPTATYNNWPNEKHLLNPVENTLDLELRELCGAYQSFDPSQKLNLRHSITQDLVFTLLLFSKRIAILGIRSKDETFIRDGLTAISMIESHKCDPRAIGIIEYFISRRCEDRFETGSNIHGDWEELRRKNR